MYHSAKEENIAPFDELIITWNGNRPSTGLVKFFVRLKAGSWSPFLLYATWGPNEQSSFSSSGNVWVYQDVVKTKSPATGFEVKVEGANPEDFRFHVYVNQVMQKRNDIKNLGSISLQVPGLSQRILDHPRSLDLCSPTSTASVIHYFTNQVIDPVPFASSVWDSGFDIFGNWVLNCAHASSILGNTWNCWVERLSGFEDLHKRLLKNTPVIVSVRGPLVGSALPYAKGHLLVVTGYDSANKQVLCMDPAFPTNEETITSYPIQDFIEAWNRRDFISYVFEK